MKKQHGYTLLELILALGIMFSVLLMLWGLMHAYTVYFANSTRRAENSQLVRSFSQLLTQDLGAAIQDPVQAHGGPLFGDDSVRRFGLRGTENTLRIDVVQINPFRTVNDENTQNRTAAIGDVPNSEPQAPELKTIYYDFVPFNSQNSGLFRRELDFETPASSMLRLKDDAESMSAPEVVGCTFKYFDGNNWASDWDSIQRSGLPVAIEVSLQIMPINDVSRIKSNPSADVSAPLSQRIVIHLPTSPLNKHVEYERKKPPEKKGTQQKTTVKKAPAKKQSPLLQTQPGAPPAPAKTKPKEPTPSPLDWIRK